MTLEELWEKVKPWLTTTGIKILISILIIIVSFTIINKISKRIAKHSSKISKDKKIDKTLYRSISYIFRVLLKILVVICVIGYLGLDTSGISALIASLGVGVGLAINGTLSNFAGGILLLITHPFKDDDFIETCGYKGTVEDIFICNTKIRTPDNKVVYLPNGKLSTSEIVNYSEKDNRRVDLTFSIAYSDDFEKAKSIISEVCKNNPFVLKNPEPTIRVTAHSASSIDIVSLVWCKNEDYWDTYFSMLEQVKKAFDENNIEIPFNQMDVHIKKD